MRTAIALFLTFSIPLFGADKAPVPTRLKEAKTAVLINNGAPLKTFDAFYTELKKWKRFDIVENKDAADVVIVLSPGSTDTAVAGVVGNVAIAGNISMITLNIADTKTNSLLWSDQQEPGAFTYSFAAKQLVKHLRERMDTKR